MSSLNFRRDTIRSWENMAARSLAAAATHCHRPRSSGQSPAFLSSTKRRAPWIMSLKRSSSATWPRFARAYGHHYCPSAQHGSSCAKIYVIDRGHLVEQGTHDELLTRAMGCIRDSTNTRKGVRHNDECPATKRGAALRGGYGRFRSKPTDRRSNFFQRS